MSNLQQQIRCRRFTGGTTIEGASAHLTALLGVALFGWFGGIRHGGGDFSLVVACAKKTNLDPFPNYREYPFFVGENWE